MKYTALLEESKITNIPRPRQRPGASLSDMYMYSENWNITWKILSYVDEFPRKKNPPIQSAQIIPRNSHRTLFDHVWDQTQIHVHLYQFIGSRWTLARYKTPRVSVTLIRHSKYQTRSLMTYQNDWKNLEVSKPTKTGWLECRFFMTQLRSVLNLS